MKKSSPLSSKSLLLAGAIALAALAPASGVHAQEENNIANVSIDAEGIYFTPGDIANFNSMDVTIMSPKGKMLLETHSTGAAVDFVCGCDQDGMYRYEVAVMSTVVNPDGTTENVLRLNTDIFTVLNGTIVLPDDGLSFQEPIHLMKKMGDTILVSAATILDWFIPSAYADQSLILAGQNPTLKLRKTDSSGGILDTWDLTAGASAPQSLSFFDINNTSSGGTVFRLSPDNGALRTFITANDGLIEFANTGVFIRNFGGFSSAADARIGINSTPTEAQLQINAVKPNIRMRDKTPGNNTTVKMAYENKTLSIDKPIKTSFDGKNEVRDGLTNVVALSAKNDADPAKYNSDAGFSVRNVQLGSQWNFRNFAQNFTITKDKTGGPEMVIGTSSGSHKNVFLEFGNGAKLTSAGKWVDGSSRELKDNIQDLSTHEAMEALKTINPVKFNYKNSNELQVGFIAEDVPNLVASEDRKHMSAMDVVAMLTKVVQDQQIALEEQREMINQLQTETIALKNEVRSSNMVSSLK